MKRLLILALLAVCAFAQKEDRGTKFKVLDASGADITLPFRFVSVDQSGSCTVNGEVVIKIGDGKFFICVAGSWTSPPSGGLTVSGNGLVVQTSPGATATRQITGVAGRTSVTNPAGVAGDIVVDTYPNPKGQVIPFGFMLGADDGPALVDTNDQASVYANQMGLPLHIAKIWCQTDTGTATINLARVSGTGSISASNIVCNTTGTASTTFTSGEDVIADGQVVNLIVVQAATSGTPHRIAVFGRLTGD